MENKKVRLCSIKGKLVVNLGLVTGINKHWNLKTEEFSQQSEFKNSWQCQRERHVEEIMEIKCMLNTNSKGKNKIQGFWSFNQRNVRIIWPQV